MDFDHFRCYIIYVVRRPSDGRPFPSLQIYRCKIYPLLFRQVTNNTHDERTHNRDV